MARDGQVHLIDAVCTNAKCVRMIFEVWYSLLAYPDIVKGLVHI